MTKEAITALVEDCTIKGEFNEWHLLNLLPARAVLMTHPVETEMSFDCYTSSLYQAVRKAIAYRYANAMASVIKDVYSKEALEQLRIAGGR